MSYAIRYYRDESTVRQYRERGGIIKPVGWVTGRDRFSTKFEADKLAAHISNRNPLTTAVQVVSSDATPTCGIFTHPRLDWPSQK